MGCLSGPKPATVRASDQVVNNEYAEITREMYDDYVSRYRPIEEQAVAENLDGSLIDDRLDEVRSNSNAAWAASRGATSRRLSDYGVTLDADQAATRERLGRQDQSASRSSALNEARRREEDRQIQVGNSLMQHGRGVQQVATGAYGQAANLEQNRAAANVQAQNAYRQQKAGFFDQMLGTAVGIGTRVWSGGLV